ncbi:MAG TPA: MBOAT family O-acyltransferase [Candidatus Obscuribacterales bacterium]
MFTTYWFITTSLLFLCIYWCVRKAQIRYWLLLAYCVFFHSHFAGPAGVLPIVLIGLLVYAAGLSQKKPFCMLAICTVVAALIAYKYRDFIIESLLAPVAPGMVPALQDSFKGVFPAAAPLAISFFAFEFVHYLVEVLKGRPPIRKLTDFAAFALFFPTLIAGPIKRYHDFLPALKEGIAHVSKSDVCAGVSRVAVGFMKKLLVADNLTRWADFQFQHFWTLPLWMRWVVAYSIVLCVYFDFSAYSDLAIGYARLMGIRVPENFNWPIVAQSMKEFWNRWHISLSTWIRDYIYVPCGGSKFGLVRQCFNGMLAFLFMGLWHGAMWHYAAMGVAFGLFLVINLSYRKALGPVGKYIGIACDRFKPLAWCLNSIGLIIGFLLFKFPLDRVFGISKLLLNVGG